MENKGFITESLLVVAGLGLLIGFWFVLFYVGWMPDYSDGQRTGDVYKFSKKGVFYKSWEGTMYLGGYHSTGGDSPTIETDKFHFSIPSSEEKDKEQVILDLKKCSETRKKCTIEYKQWFKSPIYIENSYVVTGVKMDLTD